VTAAKHYHYFAYSIQMNASEETKPSKIRDGAAFSEVTAPLAKLGCEYGHIIFNSPFDPKKDKKLGHEHFSFIKSEDLLVLTTRPPLDDWRHGEKKHMDGSSTHLEQQILWTSFRWTSCLNTRLKTEGRECFSSWSRRCSGDEDAPPQTGSPGGHAARHSVRSGPGPTADRPAGGGLGVPLRRRSSARFLSREASLASTKSLRCKTRRRRAFISTQAPAGWAEGRVVARF